MSAVTGETSGEAFPSAAGALQGWPVQQVVNLMARMEDGWPFVSQVLEEAFHQERPNAQEKGQVTRALMDWVRFRRTALFALQGDTAPEHQLAVALMLAGTVSQQDALAALHPDLHQRVLALDARLAHEKNPVLRLAIRQSLPDWVAQLLVDQLGLARAQSVAAALNAHPPQTLRANLLKGTREETQAALLAQGIQTVPSAFADTGLRVTGAGADVFQTQAFREGRVEMQDEASQLVADVVAPPPGSMVVDMCAGAGGKTLAIGARMTNKGRILALDVHDKRLEELRRRARRAGLHTVEARVLGEEPPPVRAPGAMRVLVDAPCSGLGSLRRNPEARWRLTPEDISRLQSQQLAIAESALKLVAPGGRLIYATCSFARAECEDVVAALVQKNPQLRPVTVREVLGRRKTEGLTDETGTVLRTWPDVAEMDGFFAAVLRVPAP